MRFPFSLTSKLTKYLLKKKMSGVKKYPLVLMLEPLHACNLACIGCGRIREYEDVMTEKMSLEDCLQAVDECDAPVVSICGGEPLMYPQIKELVEEITARQKHIYLCTNGIMLPKMIDQFKPSSYLFFNIHLDGTQKTHDMIVDREGVYDKALEAIKVAKEAGFIVCTNTTIYQETEVDEIVALFEELQKMDIDGLLISPAYEFEAVAEKIFLNKQEIQKKFQAIDAHSHRFQFYSTPIYLKFLKGEKELSCTPWGNVTRNVKGWKAPCYLITDGHYDSWDEFMSKVEWDNFGPGKDPRCANCMVHSGFEATVALGTDNTFSDMLQLAKWNFF